jgi:hypothetical protein
VSLPPRVDLPPRVSLPPRVDLPPRVSLPPRIALPHRRLQLSKSAFIKLDQQWASLQNLACLGSPPVLPTPPLHLPCLVVVDLVPLVSEKILRTLFSLTSAHLASSGKKKRGRREEDNLENEHAGPSRPNLSRKRGRR